MFKTAFHGGPAVEIFSTVGKNPLEKWKVTGGGVDKVYDSAVKGYIYTLENQAKIQLPKDEKDQLGLIQPFLVLQIFIPLGKNLHIEIGITDSTKTKRRLIFHSGAKELVVNPLHARIPINNFRRGQWLNLSLDVHAFAQYCFKGVLIRSIDLLIITASCKLRRIFTMKHPLYDDQEQDDPELQQMLEELIRDMQRENLGSEHVPKSVQFPMGFTYFNQLIFPQRLRVGGGTSQQQALIDENINQQNNQKPQLAFGQRLPKQQVQGNNVVAAATGIAGFKKGVVTARQLPAGQKRGAIQQQHKLNEDLCQEEDEWRQAQKPATTRRQVTKEELKEETHYLEFQQSDGSDDDDRIIRDHEHDRDDNSLERSTQVRPQAPTCNPWDLNGRANQDRTRQHHFKSSLKTDQDPSNQKKVKIQDHDAQEEEPELTGYSEYHEASIQDDPQHQMKEIMAGIQRQFQEGFEEVASPRINGKKKAKNTQGKVQLKQKEVPGEQQKKLSNYGGFYNIDQWGQEENEDANQEIEFNIEEQFDRQHEQMVKMQRDQTGVSQSSKIATSVKQKERSRDRQQNPMYIEFELNNDDEEDERHNEVKSPRLGMGLLSLPTEHGEHLDTNHYSRLESSRKEERRPFSPPFKLQQNPLTVTEPALQLNFEEAAHEDIQPQMKVQRAQILRDSLDMGNPSTKISMMQQKDLPPRATVQNEEGEHIEVIFDPILQCYYEPKTNTFYDLVQ